jgi:hypothetical protein
MNDEKTEGNSVKIDESKTVSTPIETDSEKTKVPVINKTVVHLEDKIELQDSIKTKPKTVKKTTKKSDKVTQFPVENIKIDKTDISTEEIIKKSTKKFDSTQPISIKTLSPQQLENLNKRKEIFKEKEKDKEIIWDAIEFDKDDKDKLLPILTDEQISIFSAISSDVVDEDTIRMWVGIAKDSIEQYKNIDKEIEELELTDETAKREYRQNIYEVMKESRDMLALIQQESKLMKFDFEQNKIAEHTIKVIVLNCLKDLIVKSFRYNSLVTTDSIISKEELKAKDETEALKSMILTNMYTPVIFNKFQEKFAIKSTKSVNNIFGKKYYESVLNYFVSAVKIYVKNSEDKKNIDLTNIVTRDFTCMDFIHSPMLYAYIKYDNKDKNDTFSSTLKDDTVKLLEANVNLDGYFTKNETNVLKSIYDASENAINLLMNPTILKNLYTYMNSLLNENVLFKTIKSKYNTEYNKELVNTNYRDCIVEITSKMPNIVETNLSEWGEVYKLLCMYDRFYMFYKLWMLIDSKIDNAYQIIHRTAFNCLSSLLTTDYTNYYTNMIVGLDNLINFNFDKRSRIDIFRFSVNSLIYQHSLAFKFKFDPAKCTGDDLYTFAETADKNLFDSIVIDKKDDFLLKNVNVLASRTLYYNTLLNMINNFIDNIRIWDNSEEYTSTIGKEEAVTTEKTIKVKKNKHRRR